MLRRSEAETQPMPKPLTLSQIAELQRIDTPTVCNLLEVAAPHRRGHGYTTRHLHCAFPDLPPIVGYAKTATIRAREPGPLSGADNLTMRFGYYDYVVDGPAPRISVIQDLDDHQPGYGSFWGEVNSNVHKALGCAGVVTDGSVRDIDAWAPGFFVLAGSVMPSHAHVDVVEIGGTVSVAGMVVAANDLVHADRHGAVVIPRCSRGARRCCSTPPASRDFRSTTCATRSRAWMRFTETAQNSNSRFMLMLAIFQSSPAFTIVPGTTSRR
jgi:regulator of RNase E activity RraA